MNWADFLHADTNSRNPKITLIIFGWSQSKMGAAFLGYGTLKSQEWID